MHRPRAKRQKLLCNSSVNPEDQLPLDSHFGSTVSHSLSLIFCLSQFAITVGVTKYSPARGATMLLVLEDTHDSGLNEETRGETTTHITHTHIHIYTRRGKNA